MDPSHDATIGLTLDAVVNSWNAAAEHLYGYGAAEIIGQSVEVLYPRERRADEAEMLASVFSGKDVGPFVVRRVHKDGTRFQVLLSTSATTDEQGRVIGAVTMSQSPSALQDARDRFEERIDTERAEAQDARDRFEERVGMERAEAEDARHRFEVRVDAERATSQHAQDQFERRQGSDRRDADRGKAALEEQLHQAQRLEGLGQLAGGIAHDFNNMLGVILSYASFVSEEIASVSEHDWERHCEAAQRDVEQIKRAAERAAALTRQLLAFARREVLRPRVLNLNEVVTGVEEMLRGTMGEHVELVTSLAEGLWPVLADTSQLEQVLVNLAVNARDAMPGGGTLTIDTCNLAPDLQTLDGGSPAHEGRYVQMRVGDTGTGMPSDVVEHVFEPFFTTKAEGVGTGLGLASVYGIVVQSEGQVQISSEVGRGTTFLITFPVTNELAAPIEEAPRHRPTPKGDTVLVVEDEEALREVTERILTRNGYHVLTAANGPEAFKVADHHDGDIQLLITDVVMPNMLGKEVADTVRTIRPNIAVLYMSGYARPVLASQGKLDPGVALLEKPFSEADLLGLTAQALSGPYID